MTPVQVTVEEIYNESEEEYQALLDAVDESLHPRGPDMLYDTFARFNPTAQSVVLDLGCRDAAHACELSRRFGCRVVGVDLIDANLARAHRRIAESRLGDTVQVVQGDILRLPLADATFDFIWCRDVLGHMSDLHLTFATCARVLKPGGKMLNFHVFATEMLLPEEAAELMPPLAIVPQTMDRSFYEDAVAAAGLSVIEADLLSSEWREYREESDDRGTSKQLLRIARIRRNYAGLVAKFGEKDVACELANCHYGVYQMLGKLCARAYTLEK